MHVLGSNLRILLGRARSGVSATAGAVLAGVALVLIGATVAQVPQPDLQGAYEIDPKASDDIQAAITRGTAQLNFAIRPLARRLIAKANPAYQRIVISRYGAMASLQLEARQAIQTPLDGNWVQWIREDGRVDRITGEWSYPTFVVYFQGEDGARVQRYALDPDGRTLKLHVELTSPRLPTPIDYVLVYRRQ
jgi:hypothetical protein